MPKELDRYTMYNAQEIAEFNKNNKEKGIRIFLCELECCFTFCRFISTDKGSRITYKLNNHGIYTPGYSLEVVTSKGRKFEVIENGTVIHKGKMDKFNAKEIYAMLSYNK
jgi:hypothetical protein